MLEELPFLTPLGRVVVGRAGETGEVEVSGPTTLAELRVTIERLQAHGAEQVLVDGAINRIGSASPRVSDGVVVATGGMVGDTLDEVLETTAATLDLLLLPEVSDETRARLAPHLAKSARALSFDDAGRATPLELTTVVGEGVTVAREVARLGTRTLFIGGALTQEFVDDLTRVLPPRHELRVVVRDATVLVLPAADARRFRARGIALEVLTPLARAGRHGEPVPGTSALSASGLFRRGRRQSGRPRTCLRRRQRLRLASRRDVADRRGLLLTERG